jgi:hypothetical protein
MKKAHMNKTKSKYPTHILWLVGILILVGCGGATESPSPSNQGETTEVGTAPAETVAAPLEATLAPTPEEANPAAADNMEAWLAQIQAGDIESYNVSTADGAEQSFRWGLGFLTYYGSMEGVGLDNLIYNALRAHMRLATGETTADNLPRNSTNFFEIAEGLQLDPDIPAENQIGQTPALRQAILDKVVADQHTLSPDEALASGEIMGVIAIPSPEDIGAKYLVYGQAMPGEPFVFVGVVLVVDAITRESASTVQYSSETWDGLPWLGDAGGPFWEKVPAGGSGDPTKTNEGRPGVLFVHEGQYQAVK